MDYTKYTDSLKLPVEKLELALVPEKKYHIFLTLKQKEAYSNAIEYLKYYMIATEKCPMSHEIYKYFLFGLSDMLKEAYRSEYNELGCIEVTNLNRFFDEKNIQFHVEVSYDRPFAPTFKIIRWITWKEFI